MEGEEISKVTEGWEWGLQKETRVGKTEDIPRNLNLWDPPSLKPQLFLSQTLHSLYKSPSHWCPLLLGKHFKAHYGAPWTTLIVIRVEMVSDCEQQPGTLGSWCPSWQAHCIVPSSHAKLWSFATPYYYHIPAQWGRFFQQILRQLHYSVHSRQAAHAPGGSFFSLWSYKIKNEWEWSSFPGTPSANPHPIWGNTRTTVLLALMYLIVTPLSTSNLFSSEGWQGGRELCVA